MTPQLEPDSLRAGDTWLWTVPGDAYPSPGWVMTYQFKSPAAGFSFSGAAIAPDHAISVPSSTTATFPAGTYQWVRYATSGGARITIDQGELVVLPDFSVAGALDARTTAEKILAAIEQLLLGFTDVQEYVIGDRSVKRMTRLELLKARDQLKSEVANEEAADSVARGLGNPRRLFVRSGRA
jgi:hypothetical protein